MTYEATMFYSDIEAVKTARTDKVMRVMFKSIIGFTVLAVVLWVGV